MEGDVFPSMLPPPPEPLKVAELDERAKRRHEMRVMDGVRDKVEAKSKRMANVFRQFDENKDGDISYDEFRQGLAHLGVELSDDDYAMLVKKVDVDGEGTVDYNEFAEVLKAPDMQLSFMPTDAPFAGTADVSSMKTDMEVKRAGADGSASQARKQMGMAMLPKDDILRQISEKVESKSKNLRNVFRDFDEDKSGTVDVIEFRRGLAHLGFEMTNKQYDALLNRVDRDSDGDINYNEFAARLKGQDMQMGGIGGIGVQDWQAEAEAIREKTAAETSKEMGLGRGSAEVKLVEDIAAKVEGKSKYIRKVFRDFDEDFDGTVNHEEFKKGLEHLGVKLDDKKFNMLLKLVDQDESGSVDYLEFSNVLKGQDMQIGNQIGGTEDPKLAALRSQGGEPAPAPASSLPPPPGPAPAPAAMAAAPAAAAKAPTGPPKLPVGFKPPSSSGSYRSNSSSKKMSARAASRQSDIDSVRDLPM
jgi:Ca2+-binding EF-hand superfamily protein